MTNSNNLQRILCFPCPVCGPLLPRTISYHGHSHCCFFFSPLFSLRLSNLLDILFRETRTFVAVPHLSVSLNALLHGWNWRKKKKKAKDTRARVRTHTHTLGNNLQLEANRACFGPLEEEVDSTLNATQAKLISRKANLDQTWLIVIHLKGKRKEEGGAMIMTALMSCRLLIEGTLGQRSSIRWLA